MLTRQAWSGEILVRDAVSYRLVDLYAQVGSESVEELPAVSAGPDQPIVLELTGRRNAAARDGQVWVLGIRNAAGIFHPERGTPVTEVCRILHGRHGSFLALRTDTGVAEALAETGMWEPRQVALFERLLRAGEAALDIGANIGHHSVVLSHLVGASGRVAAFEPQMQMYNLLNANLVLNGCRNVLPLRLALGSAAATLAMYPISYDDFQPFGSLGICSATQGITTRGETVPAARLDDILPSLELDDRPLSLIKIDVQAFELFVLQGAESLLRREHPSISIEIAPFYMRQAGYDWRAIFTLLESFGYAFYDEELRPMPLWEWDGQSKREWQSVAVHSRYRDRIS
jgi:FkbM family methyltransferase